MNTKRQTRMRKQARSIDAMHKPKYLGKNDRSDRYKNRNTSLWCTPLLELVIDFISEELLKRGGISGTWNMQIVHTNLSSHGYARGFHSHVAHNRCCPRSSWKYVGISWAKDHKTITALQSLCHILAHELIHTTRLIIPQRSKTGRRDKQGFEFATDNLAAEVVAAFVDYEPIIWRKYKKIRRTARNKALRNATTRTQAQTPDAKLQRAKNLLEQWTQKKEKAEKMVHKHQVKVNRMVGARKRTQIHIAKAACKGGAR